MITTQISSASFQSALSDHIRKEIDLLAEDEAQQAAINVERRVRAKVAGIATQIVSKMSFERFGDDLRITVHFPKDESSNSPVDHS